MRNSLCILVLLSGAQVVQASEVEAHLVKDIATASASATANSSPANFRQFGGRAYFNATTPLLGRELYISDGVSPQAQLVHDFAAGTASSYAKAVGLAGGRLIVEADDGLQGNALLALDRSTGATTTLLGFGGAGSSEVAAKPVAQLANHVLFRTLEHLLTTDGTLAGTQRLVDMPYSANLANSICVLGSGAMFVAPSASATNTLWHTGGARASNRVVAGLAQESGLVAVSGNGSQCYFLFTRGSGWTLWRSDGNSATFMAAQGGVYGRGVAAASNFAYVIDGGSATTPFRLWRSNFAQPLASYPLEAVSPSRMRTVGDKLVFNGPYQDGSSTYPRTGIFVSDGSAAGTRRVTPAAGLEALGEYQADTVSGSALLLGSMNSIWRIDPAAGSVVRVGDGLDSLNWGDSTALNGALIGNSHSEAAGSEVFRSDGSSASPQLLHDVWQANASSLYYAEPGVSIGNTLFLSSIADPRQQGDGRTALWRSDGSEAGTQPLPRSSYGEGDAQSLVRFGDRIVFGSREASTSSAAFYLTDATFSTTSQLVAASYFDTLQAFGANGAGGVLMGCQFGGPFVDKHLCSVRSGESQAALIAPNLLNSGYMLPIGSSGGAALFFHRSSGSTAGLWRSDGTAPGTVRLDPDLRAVDPSYGDVAAFPFQGRLLFNACNDLTGQCGLYISDGSQAGTQFVAALPLRVQQFAALGERVALVLGQSNDQQLWISDGTAAGTDLLRSFAGRSVSPLASFGDRLHFVVGAPWPGNLPPDYYVSDGRKEGTAPVALPAGMRPDGLPIAVLDEETAAFGCRMVETGSELCAIDSDGSHARLIMDILPGPESSRATLVGTTSDASYYAADDGYHGVELWQVKARSERIFRDGFQ